MLNQLKVVQIGDSFFPHMDGVTRVIHNYGVELSRYITTIIVFPKRKGYDYQAPYRSFGVSSFHFKPLDIEVARPFLAGFQLRTFLAQEKPQILHLHSPFFLGQIALNYAKKHHLKVVATLHSQYHQDFDKYIPLPIVRKILMGHVRRFYNRCDEVWTVNQAMGEVLRGYGYIGKVRIVPNASDFDEPLLLTPEEEKEFRATYGLPQHRKILLFVGQMSTKKNLSLLIDSVNLLPKSDENPLVVLIGIGEDLSQLKKKVNDLLLEGDIFFLGKITQRHILSKFYSLAHLFVFPSTYDASSIAVMEAASHGLPSLLIRGAATAETIVDQENGFLAEATAESLSVTILRALDHPRYQQISENALNTVSKSWRTIGQEVMRFYQEICNND